MPNKVEPVESDADDESEFETSDSEYYNTASETASEATIEAAIPDSNGQVTKDSNETETPVNNDNEENDENEQVKKPCCTVCCYNCKKGARKIRRRIRRFWRQCWPLRKVRKAWRRLHRKSDDDEMSGGARCCFGFLVFIAQILLHGVVGLVLFWVIQYHKKEGSPFPFSWRDDPELEFNLHPVLMVTGFIYFMGQAMLMYRTCRCCRRIWSKLLHTTFHLLAVPCIAVAFIAVWDYHALHTDKDGNPNPIPHFYSLHSWMGLTTMGLFALQFVVGFFSFLLLLCCESATASFRAALVPIHSTFGITTFVMAVATACTGLTEKAFFNLSTAYRNWVPYLIDPNFNRTRASSIDLEPYTIERFAESMVINVLAAALIGLVIVMPILVLHPKFRSRSPRIITVTHDRYG